MNFVTIDFETANSSRDSICAIGLVLYENAVPTQRFESLIKPEFSYFDPFNVSIHGITEKMVRNSPESKPPPNDAFSPASESTGIKNRGLKL